MAGFHYLLIISVFLLKINGAEHFYPDSGWRPISKEQVFGVLQKKLINVPGNAHLNTWKSRNYDIPTEDAIKIVDPYDLNLDLMAIAKDYGNSQDENVAVRSDINENKAITTESVLNEDLSEQSLLKNIESIRKPKKINDLFIDLRDITITDNVQRHNHIKTKTETDDTKDTNVKLYKYEVVENLNETEIPKDQNSSEDTLGYTYEAPDNKSKNNLVNSLFNILSNYNIRTNDQLTNYDSSRHKEQSLKQKYVYLPIVPLRISSRFEYNNQNHLTVDPVLAVFLSNYGYYLPGLYGHNKKYNNLYGYLASNNIHNNGPFGNYKIFSDTDSAN